MTWRRRRRSKVANVAGQAHSSSWVLTFSHEHIASTVALSPPPSLSPINIVPAKSNIGINLDHYLS